MKKVVFLMLLPILAWSSDMKLVGSAMLQFSVFKIDVYEASYFQGDSGQEKIVLNYKRDIRKRHSVLGWQKGLRPFLDENPEFKPKIQWILNNTLDLNEGDVFTIKKDKNQVTLLKNGTITAQIEDAEISQMILTPWIGKQPIDDELKQKLLGLSKENP